MCPDYDLLSAYIDGEVETPWKGEIENHLQVCAVCREKVALFNKLSGLLAADPEPDCGPSLARLKTMLESIPAVPKKAVIPFWKKKILIPVPVAAIAATLLISIGTFFTITVANFKPAARNKTDSVITERPVAQDDELSTIIKLMENKDFNNEVIFQLPEGSQFSINGEPRFIRAKDLNRSK